MGTKGNKSRKISFSDGPKPVVPVRRASILKPQEADNPLLMKTRMNKDRDEGATFRRLSILQNQYNDLHLGGISAAIANGDKDKDSSSESVSVASSSPVKETKPTG